MIDQPKDEQIGKAAYEKYAGLQGWQSISGQRMLRWDEHTEERRECWRKIARAAVDANGSGLTRDDSLAIAEELERNANVIARYFDDNKAVLPESVNVALSYEMRRLRTLADKVRPRLKKEEEK